ncbi:Mrp/NBP35 family ATP-binding protein [Parasphaerochaeta coccoides]|uniref:Iron-sulfur cluster carrier protein n=1 Tax=Parasphaerochaeta coccoides (strain ATCC BAA-1237 / DSM 17374 / SPN1) TaxID=760011 RepID=F4GM41_PARC1|nr:Mrp/NBP35 family ATP-binding protein [Parasphaerochaeta coccoides]AEC02516.1 ATPase-like, ParA/MinD [Parasphaerochaeta coccoides DSM 17374]
MAGEYMDFEAQITQMKKIKERMDRIRRKILVMSGKGGVGKTTVTVNLANALVDAGRKVGVLDTDLHGPNVAKMFGVEGRLMETEDGTSLFPVEPRPGLKVVSLSFALSDSDAPVVWRGPMKLAAIKQFLADVEWGNLDYLLIDTPPGTGDEPLAVIQNLPGLTGSIIVTTAQAVAVADSRKSVTFSRRLGVPILGVVENMSGLRCPHCSHEIPIFGIGGGKLMAQDMSVPFLGRVPIEVELREAEDAGTSWVSEPAAGPSAVALREIASYIDALEDDYLEMIEAEAKKVKAEADEADKRTQEENRNGGYA